MVNKRNHPKLPYFRLVNFYNLPSYIFRLAYACFELHKDENNLAC